MLLDLSPNIIDLLKAFLTFCWQHFGFRLESDFRVFWDVDQSSRQKKLPFLSVCHSHIAASSFPLLRFAFRDAISWRTTRVSKSTVAFFQSRLKGSRSCPSSDTLSSRLFTTSRCIGTISCSSGTRCPAKKTQESGFRSLDNSCSCYRSLGNRCSWLRRRDLEQHRRWRSKGIL